MTPPEHAAGARPANIPVDRPQAVPTGRDRLGIVLLALILALSAALRLHGLGAKSLWYNEADSSCFLDLPASEILSRSAEARAVHPPLYFLALDAWARAWGYSDASLRSLAAACGVLLVAGVYLLTKELARLGGDGAQDAAPALAAALVALSPLQVHLARQVRGYSLAAMLLAWAGWALIRALRAGRAAAPWWAAAALLALAACYTHHVATLSVAAQAAFAAAYLLAQRGATTARSSARGAWVAVAILGVGYVAPWLSRLVVQGEAVRGDYHEPIGWSAAAAQASLALGATMHTVPPRPGDVVTWAAILPASALAWLAVRGGWRGRYLAATGLLPVLVLAAFSARSDRSLVMARYLAFAQLSWLVGLAVVACGLRGALERRAAVAWALVASAACAFASWPVIGPEAKPGMRAAVEHVLRNRRGDEPVISPSPYAFCGLQHYTRGRVEPRMLVAERGRSTQRRGSERLRDVQLVTADALDAARPAGLWVVTGRSYAPDDLTPFPQDDGWVLDGIWSFDQDYYLEGPVIVAHYRPRPDRPSTTETDPRAKARAALPPAGLEAL